MVVVASNFVAPVEGVILETPNTKLVVNDQVMGTATLYITENNVVWGGGFTPTGIVASTLSLLYPTISLHAVQREPSPALYLQLNYELELPGLQPSGAADQENQTDDDEDTEAMAEELDPITQIRFVPENEAVLPEMFGALMNGQSMHPDPDVEDDFFMGEGEGDDEDDNDMFEDAEESSGEYPSSRFEQLNINHGNGHKANVPKNTLFDELTQAKLELVQLQKEFLNAEITEKKKVWEFEENERKKESEFKEKERKWKGDEYKLKLEQQEEDESD